MRILCLLLLVAFFGAVALFAYQNQGDITLTFWDRSLTAPLPFAIGGIYLAGMLTGWTVVGLLRRSVNTVVTTHHGRVIG